LTAIITDFEDSSLPSVNSFSDIMSFSNIVTILIKMDRFFPVDFESCHEWSLDSNQMADN
jgi:hypothetical protein